MPRRNRSVPRSSSSSPDGRSAKRIKNNFAVAEDNLPNILKYISAGTLSALIFGGGSAAVLYYIAGYEALVALDGALILGDVGFRVGGELLNEQLKSLCCGKNDDDEEAAAFLPKSHPSAQSVQVDKVEENPWWHAVKRLAYYVKTIGLYTSTSFVINRAIGLPNTLQYVLDGKTTTTFELGVRKAVETGAGQLLLLWSATAGAEESGAARRQLYKNENRPVVPIVPTLTLTMEGADSD